MNRSLNSSTYLNRQQFHDPPQFRRKSRELVFVLALGSRFLSFLIGLVSVWYGGQYDSSVKVLGVSYPSLRCFVNWDGARFADIARYGYSYEESHAFFPLMPMAMRATERYVLFWVPMFNEIDLYALAGGVVSWTCFVGSALVMYELSTRILGDARLALRSSILYCFNPASIFFTVAYSESLFALLGMTGMLLLAPPPYNDKQEKLLMETVGGYDSSGSDTGDDDDDDPNRPSFLSFRRRFLATLCFAAATLTRSNGVLLGIFSLHAGISMLPLSPSIWVALLDIALIAVPHAAALLAVLGHAFVRFCVNNDSRPKWCSDSGNVYTHVQQEYWKLGAGRFYKLNQIPNFMLAFPIFALGSTAAVDFSSLFEMDLDTRKAHSEFFGGSVRERAERRYNLRAHAVHLALHLAVAAAVMHVQVATRFVCAACPCLYWYCAVLTKRRGKLSFLVLVYFLLYFAMGSAMFCAFLPWT